MIVATDAIAPIAEKSRLRPIKILNLTGGGRAGGFRTGRCEGLLEILGEPPKNPFRLHRQFLALLRSSVSDALTLVSF